MTDPLTDAANAISSSSPKVRAFAQLSAKRTIALEARVAALEAPAPTPTPTPELHAGNGFLLFRYGSSWAASPVTGYARYGVVVVGYGNDFDAAKLPTLGLGYRTPVELEDVADAQLSTGGVTLTQAKANGWLLKDAAGNPVTPNGYSGQWCGNLSHPAYQAACIATYNARAKATGLRGFFLDNVVPSPWFNATPANIYGGLSFSDAYLSFLAALRQGCPSLYFLANCGPGGAAWGAKIAPYVNGMVFEGYTGSTGAQAALQAYQAAGRDAFAISIGDPASSTIRGYAQAFASGWNRHGGGFAVDYTNPATQQSPDPWNVNWTSVIPAPA